MENKNKFVGGKKARDKWRFIKCPKCGYETDIISAEDDLYVCPNCGYKWDGKNDWYERDIDGYICGGCGKFVPDISSNWIWGNRELGLLCPYCHGLIKVGPMHHGECLGEFKPKYIGTDYFRFFHKCGEAAEIISVVIDDEGRIIFTLMCPKCKTVDAIKISVNAYKSKEHFKGFYLTNGIRKNAKKW